MQLRHNPFFAICFLVLLLKGHSPIVGDDSRIDVAALGIRCKSILRRALDGPLPDDPFRRETLIGQLNSWPIELAESKLVAALDDKSNAVKMIAAEILLKRTGMKHIERIRAMIKKVKPKTSLEAARIAVLQLRLGEKNALAEVRRWAMLDVRIIQKLTPWTCAMHPQIRAPGKGACPICSMELIDFRGYIADADRHAQFVALLALGERKDERAANLARAMIASDAGPMWRLGAAHELARLNPDEGLPHVRVFLHSTDPHIQHEVITLLADDFAKQSVREFESILKKSAKPSMIRLSALQGLVEAGHVEHLDEIRKLTSAKDKRNIDAITRSLAMLTLGDCGTKDDLAILARHLETSDAHTAARAIVTLIDRLKK